jgi:predicted GNAT family acetyltransferase
MPALELDEARHNMMLAVLGALAEGRSPNVATWTLGLPGQCATMSPGRPILLADLADLQCRTLAEETAQAHVEYSGVRGPDETAFRFAERAIELGIKFLEPIPQRIHGLAGKPKYPGAAGYARRATAEDASIVADWVTSFTREANPHEPAPSHERLNRLTGEALFWIVDDEPVSMAAIVRRTRNAAAISIVYTPPSLRSKGYAGSVTAAVAEQAFAEGKRVACLYTDLRNPFSNRCYVKIGFEPVCDSAYFPRAIGGQ